MAIFAKMKRKLNEDGDTASKKRIVASDQPNDPKAEFRPDLFEDTTVESFRKSYEVAGPYPHAVVPSLIQEPLLRSVRSEIMSHIHFTLKETDIYRIHQSGDLANLSNLDAGSLKHLPNLVRLRDALYSPDFREWVSTVTGAGKVSGKKTDMAVNVYTPGSYLLCHDDVIGSRRVSYILYLTDPDHPWQPEWGGGLRLFPTEVKKNKAGEDIKVPLAEHSLTIPPAFGQLSFFAVRPGESYHDVEEVYYGPNLEADGGRIRMAISGWFHIPQEGEDGFEEGIEQAQAHRSTLAQLKSAATEFDEPQLVFRHFDEPRAVMDSHAAKKELDPGEDQDPDENMLTEQDLTFLLHYISPSYLTPDMIEDFQESFGEMSVLQLEQFFAPRFAAELKEYISKVETESESSSKSHPANWAVARPPHKHRFAYLQGSEALHRDKTPISRILTDLLHSHAFKKWLALVTGLKPKSLVRQNMIARRFRHGKDYALANPFLGEQPQLEFTISITPSEGWERNDGDDDEEADGEESAVKKPNGSAGANGASSKPTEPGDSGKGKGKAREVERVQVTTSTEIEFGGEEVYMAGDDDDDDDKASVHSKSLPSVGKKADPAIYKSSNGEDEDDGILFANPAAWNRFSIVLRDKGTLRFVKYVSQAAAGDRWDIKGEIEVSPDAWDDDENEGNDQDGEAGPSL
ncbi:putative component of NuA3 histone acetyltransferase complex [Exophiala dermatitidis]|nr:putative component of NuA3 histone acetyltransferase complex [Exophiala dermatitidis]KAJ4552896.1 putative component of NuA3 histone acetyltransferase complex [Exophiala dermatitidis]